jgi:hypothetical protein
MLSFFRSAPEWVHFIDIREGNICFLLHRPKKAGSKMRVRFPLTLPAPKDKLDVWVTMTACRSSRGDGYIGVAQPNLPPAERLELAETLRKYCLVRAPEQLTEVRQTERTRVSLRVMGRHLPYYRAVALDLTAGGMKLHCQGPLEVGTVMELCIDTDVAKVEEIRVKARVAWTLNDPQPQDSDIRSCVAGMQFLSQTPKELSQLGTYLSEVAKRGDSEQVTHRLVTN